LFVDSINTINEVYYYIKIEKHKYKEVEMKKQYTLVLIGRNIKRKQKNNGHKS